MAEKRNLAPDGGWGWVVTAAFSLNNIIILPVYQVFGLAFRNVFRELDLTNTQISTVLNVNTAFGFLLGLFNGPMLKTYGYRKVGLGSVSLAFLGYFLTSRASSYTQLIMFYGIINSAGSVLTIAAFNLALNTYFSKKRNRASGFCMTATGIGLVFMPLVISKLIEIYGERGCALIMSALILNCFPAVMLLHPISWHYKQQDEKPAREMVEMNANGVEIGDASDDDEDDDDDEEEEEDDDGMVEEGTMEAMMDVQAVLVPTSKLSEGQEGRKQSVVIQPDPLWWSRSSLQMETQQNLWHTSKTSIPNIRNRRSLEDSDTEESRPWYRVLYDSLDLDLLKDSGYRVILAGMAMAYTAESNFLLLTPIILGDRNFTVEDTARILSAMGVTDVVFRFVSPFVGEWLKMSARYMWLNSVVMLVVFREGLCFVDSYWGTMGVCLGLGAARGFRTVYVNLVVPNYVPLEKLPSAAGLQSLSNGIFVIACGPFFGYIRDATGDYNLCIHLMNALSMLTIVMWTIEYFFVVRKKNNDRGSA